MGHVAVGAVASMCRQVECLLCGVLFSSPTLESAKCLWDSAAENTKKGLLSSKQRRQAPHRHFTMQPPPRWTWRSTATAIFARLFPRHGHSLPHIARLIDEFVVESLDARVLADACELGASPVDLDFLLVRTAPDWSKVVQAAARGGHVHVFRWMRERQDLRGPWEGDFEKAVTQAARYGRLELIKWLHERGLTFIGMRSIVAADVRGQPTVHEHFSNISPGWVTAGMRCAARTGHLATVQWLYENFKDDVRVAPAMAGAAESGDLEMLQWLHHQKSCPEACSTYTMNAAVRGGHFRLVEWLFENCSKGCSTYAARGAARAGNLPMLHWLHTHYSDRFDSGAMDNAASGGHLETVKWLHAHRPEGCSSYAMNLAARNGHVDVVRWLHDNRTEGCTARAMDYAAEGGHLELVKWLHANRSEGCTAEAACEAARNGHVDVLKWLVEHFPDKCRDALDRNRCLERPFGRGAVL